MRRFQFSLFGLLLGTLLAAAPAYALDIPTNDGYVTDDGVLMTAEQEEGLEANLKSYEDTTSNQLAVLTVRSLSGADIGEFSIDVFRKWGIGQAENNNGALMVIAYEERKIWIATGYGLEGALPDLAIKGIVETDILPPFRDGDYYEGISAGLEAMQKHIGGEYTAERYEESASAGFMPWIFFFVFILFNGVGAFLARSKTWWAGGILGGVFGLILTIIFSWWYSIPVLVALGLLFDYIVSQGGGRGGRGGRGGFGGFGGMGGGSSSSGGFGGFGGGSTGGGGAGGSW